VYSIESGKKAQVLAYLAEALRLNPENRKAANLTIPLLAQGSWHVPLTGSMQHDARIYSAQFSPDGQRVVTASDDRQRGCGMAPAANPIGEPMKHEEAVYSAQFSPIVSGCDRLRR